MNVCHLHKLLRHIVSDTLRRRVGIIHLRMASLKVLKLVHHEIKFLVADNRRIMHIIAFVVFVQLLSQLQYSVFFFHYG